MEKKESRTPAKKNRVHLDGTAEEDDAPSESRNSYSPPLSTSPPHEIKVRQISQGVEDINWRSNLTSQALNDQEDELEAELDVEIDDENDGEDDDGGEENADVMTSMNAPHSLSLLTNTQVEDRDLPPQSNTSSQATMELHDEATATVMDVHHDGPPTTQLSEMETQPDLTVTVNGKPNDLPMSRRGSESDGTEKEKGLKRKLGDRAISLGPNDAAAAFKVTTTLDPFKRSKDNSNDSEETLKHSPPPETASGIKEALNSSVTPKVVRISFSYHADWSYLL
jgi:Ran-binding protein 3